VDDPASTGQTLLLVEDNEDNRIIYCTVLRHLGYEVIEAQDGVRAVELARSVQPDLILMDISIPRMDGWEATRILRGDSGFNPTAVSLQRPEPNGAGAFQRMFRAPVSFGQVLNAIDYRRVDCDERLPSANAELARQNDEVAMRYLSRLKEASVSLRVQQALLKALPDGAPEKGKVARELGMSARNLQRHLAEEGTSFKGLLNDARVTLARNYVAEGRLSVTEIAFLLGFADTSTFSRAFKRWTGKSPRDYASIGDSR